MVRAAPREHAVTAFIEGIVGGNFRRLEVLPHHVDDSLARGRSHLLYVRESGAGIDEAP